MGSGKCEDQRCSACGNEKLVKTSLILGVPIFNGCGEMEGNNLIPVFACTVCGTLVIDSDLIDDRNVGYDAEEYFSCGRDREGME